MRAQAANPAPEEKELTAALAEAYLKLGKIFTTEKKYQQAVSTLQTAAIYRPDSPELLIDLAIAYFNAGQYEEALGPLNRASTVNPQSASVHQMLGKTWFMLGNFDQLSVTFGQPGSNPVQWKHFFYIQDEFKVAPRFTLTAGTRWEPYLPWDQKYHRHSFTDRRTHRQRERENRRPRHR